MDITLKIPRGDSAVPVLVVEPDGSEKLELYQRSVKLSFFAPGTQVYLYEPVTLEVVSIMVVPEG